MILHFYINDVLLFESQGELTLTAEVLKLAGFKGNFNAMKLNVLNENEAEVRVVWGACELTDDECTMVQNRQPVLAIKSVRARKGIGLKEAKDLVDEYRKSIGDM